MRPAYNIARQECGHERTARVRRPLPHAIARQRIAAYQKHVVMRYLDNLIAWGDQLYRRDTIEAINEATQLYILAGEILGPRPHSCAVRKVE